LVIAIALLPQMACPAGVQHPSSNELKTARQSVVLSLHQCLDERLPVPLTQEKVLTFEMKQIQLEKEELDNCFQDKGDGLKSQHELGLQQSQKKSCRQKRPIEANPTITNGVSSPKSHQSARPPATSNPTFTANKTTTRFHSPEKSPDPIKDQNSGLSVGNRNRNIMPGELTRLSHAGIVGKPTDSGNELANVSRSRPNCAA
jgi:hypothetical protein